MSSVGCQTLFDMWELITALFFIILIFTMTGLSLYTWNTCFTQFIQTAHILVTFLVMPQVVSA